MTTQHDGATASTRPERGRPAPDVECYIDGEFVSTGATFDNVDPTDGSVISRVHEASADHVERAVSAARDALSGPWSELDVLERATILRRVAELAEERFDDLLVAEQRDTGKPVAWASTVDIPRAAGNFRSFAELMFHHPEEAWHSGPTGRESMVNYSYRKPLGVVAAIVPWNLPLLLATWKIAPALACGNTVVVKPSEFTPTSVTVLAEIIESAGVPRGVFNVVHGFGGDSAGQYLTESSAIDGITFTGGTATGTSVMAAASRTLTPVSLELGGKNAAIVYDDADLDQVIPGIVRSTFANTGQVCLCTERVYVHDAVFDEFVERLTQATREVRLGDPTDPATTMGPLISQEHRDKVLACYDLARAEGAELLVGGGIPDLGELFDRGSWIEPTVWTGLDDRSATQQQEIFGPACHITSFASESEAIALANGNSYGLAASVWSGDVARAHRTAQRIDAGLVWINTWFRRDLRTPFGGTNQSGIGREGGRHSLDFYTRVSNVCVAL